MLDWVHTARNAWQRPQSIPRHIVQSGPSDESAWPDVFRRSYGTWQRSYPHFQYTFWNDSRLDEHNPNALAFVRRHFPRFVPAWLRLCSRVMRFDVARYMWLYVHGGIYADLDLTALAPIPAALLDAYDVLHPAVQFRSYPCLFLYQRRDSDRVRHNFMLRSILAGRGCPHLGNWWLASVPRHPLWLRMIEHVESHVEELCRATRKGGRGAHNAILELTGPYALHYVLEEYIRQTGDGRIGSLPNQSHYIKYASAGTWLATARRGDQRGEQPKQGWPKNASASLRGGSGAGGRLAGPMWATVARLSTDGLLQHFTHSTDRSIPLYATNPSLLAPVSSLSGGGGRTLADKGSPTYLIRITPFAPRCQQRARFTHTRQVPAYEANSYTALTRLGDAAHAAPLVRLPRSEDARALFVTAGRQRELWVTYSSTNVSAEYVAGAARCWMVLQRLTWPQARPLSPPVRLRLANPARVEKNWIPLRRASKSSLYGRAPPPSHALSRWWGTADAKEVPLASHSRV